MSGKPIIKANELQLAFGGLQALDGVSIDLYPDEVLGLIGPNGAGKSALLNCINGFYFFDSGNIYFKEANISKLPSHRRAMMGLGRTFQGVQTYSGMTVLQNIMAGQHVHLRTGVLSAFFHWPFVYREELEARKQAEDLIDFLDLQPYRHQFVGGLGYGLRKRVDLGRALAMKPDVLLMDEPMAGMNVDEKEDMARFVLDVSEEHKISVVLVEHDMGVVMDICDRIVVMDWGKVISVGTPKEIINDPKVIKAYLGEGA